jgi:hypothetical protein
VVTITNSGNANLVIGNIAGNNPLAFPFSIVNDSCSVQTISPSSSCTLKIRFSPLSSGIYSDTFDIPSDDPDESTISISVNGNGTPPPVPDISVTDSSGSATDLQIPFGNITENLSSEKTVTITNTGNANLVIGSIATVNPLVSEFAVVNDNCSGTSINPSSNCTFKVRFNPVTTGLFNDSFDIPSNDPDEPSVVFSVSGTGVSSIVNNPPDTPELVYPANNQNGLDVTVQFRWKNAADPDGDPVSYDLYICEDESFATGCITRTNVAYLNGNKVAYAGFSFYLTLIIFMASGLLYSMRYKRKIFVLVVVIVSTAIFLVSCGGGGGGGAGGILQGGNPVLPDNSDESIYTVSGLSAGTVYYWKVVADDGNGNTTESSAWQFQTQ